MGPVVPQSYSQGCATATLSSTSSPTIAQLTGTVFAAAYTPKASIGAVRVSGTKVTVALKCSGKAKSSCRVTLELLVSNAKTKKTVVAGAKTTTLTAGKHKTATVALNASGKRLLVPGHTLKATLVAVQVGAVVANRRVTFRAPKTKR